MKKLATATVLTLALAAAPAAGVAGAAEKPPAEGKARHLRPCLARAVGTAAEAIGIPAKELGKGLRDGKSIAEVAEANDVDPQAVVDALVTAGTKRIDTAVEAGKLDAERAAKFQDRLAERVAKVVNREPGQHRSRRSARVKARRHARRAAVRTVAETIGIEPEALREQVRDGKSIAEVAEANDVDPQAVVDALVAAGTKRIDAAVAAGKLDADRAAKLEARLAERVTKLVNRTR
jgi:predicted DNA-binding protein YlxM (UPF0122 family)